MPCDHFYYYAMCHNLKPSSTIIVNDGDQYFEKKIICPNFFIVPHGSKFFKVYQNLVTTSHILFFPLILFGHVKTHLWMIIMESRILMVKI